jgi:hypothetical protein
MPRLYLVASNDDPRPNLNEMIATSGCSAECDEAHVEHVFHMMAAVYVAGFVSCLALLIVGLWVVGLAR